MALTPLLANTTTPDLVAGNKIAVFSADLGAGAGDVQAMAVVDPNTGKPVGGASSTVTAPAQTSQGAAAAQILAANASRKRLIVQNTGTTVIKLALGAGTLTQTAYHVSLAPGAAADDGTGAAYIDEVWTGAVQAISSAGGGTLVVTELT